MATNFPNGVESFGVPVLGGGKLTTGNVFFVDSGAANSGDSVSNGAKSRPFATLDYAIGQCTASNGDVIYVMPGHAETVSAAGGLDIDVAGISIVGIGNGDNRPTVTLGTATTADVDVDADDVLIQNLRFVSAIDSLAVMLDVNAENVHIDNCEFKTSSALECLNFINMATTKDYLRVSNCQFYQPTDPGGTDAAADTGAIFLVDSEHVVIENCEFYGNFETGIIHNRTTACENLWIRDCIGISNLSTAVPITLVTSASGGIVNSHFISPNADDVTEAKIFGVASADFFVFNSTFGNDGDGGQLGVAGAAAAT